MFPSFQRWIYGAQWRWRQWLVGLRCSAGQRGAAEALSGEPSRLLFVLTGLLGDSVMCQPAIAAARDLWPGVKTTVLGKRHNRELLKADPCIDEFYVCDADPFSLRQSAEISGLKEWLQESKFDAAIILLGDQFAHLLAGAGIPVRVGVKGTILEPCLTHVYEIGSPREWGTKERLNCLRVLGADITDLPPKLYVDADAARTAYCKLAGLGLGPDQPYVVFHPFGSTQRQWWPPEIAAEFLSKAAAQDNRQFVIIGGKETADVRFGKAGFIDTRGRLSISELIAVIDRADLAITTDSGPFHMAGALGKPTIGLFRGRRPEHANAYPTAKVIFGHDARCMKECKWDACAASPCRQMEKVASAAVLVNLDEGIT